MKEVLAQKKKQQDKEKLMLTKRKPKSNKLLR